MPLALVSKAFTHCSAMPRKFTREGANASPPLAWSGVPQGTAGFVLLCEDPDAPARTWSHWVLFNLPASLDAVPENVARDQKPAFGGVHGTNDFGSAGYDGPSPPSGSHRYYFKLFALDAPLELPAGASRDNVLKAMEGHVLGKAELVGVYTKGNAAAR
ncbi:MAG TPA: YbhB/YbcL family Raf kinase inhibitor-like protein [Verrucomicrobiae bacterium]|jgi:Raf kinase inhibitor-like YbhB/YbcL family protein|nr:YbhB/YbcL family Raf kinase inhibitor-like protein [Verrucomicrobiae bacterium]